MLDASGAPPQMPSGDNYQIAFYPDNWRIAGQLFRIGLVVAIVSQFSRSHGIAYQPSNGKLLFFAVIMGICLIISWVNRVQQILIDTQKRLVIVTWSRFFARRNAEFDLLTAELYTGSEGSHPRFKDDQFRIESELHSIGIKTWLSGWSEAELNEVAATIRELRTKAAAANDSGVDAAN